VITQLGLAPPTLPNLALHPRRYPIWPCTPDVQQEGELEQIVRKFGKKSYSSEIVLKIGFAHTGTALHAISHVCDQTCHRNYHLPF